MTKQRRVLLGMLALAVVAGLMMAACEDWFKDAGDGSGDGGVNPFVGTWTNTYGQTVTFNADGTATSMGQNFTYTCNGNNAVTSFMGQNILATIENDGKLSWNGGAWTKQGDGNGGGGSTPVASIPMVSLPGGTKQPGGPTTPATDDGWEVAWYDITGNAAQAEQIYFHASYGEIWIRKIFLWDKQEDSVSAMLCDFTKQQWWHDSIWADDDFKDKIQAQDGRYVLIGSGNGSNPQNGGGIGTGLLKKDQYIGFMYLKDNSSDFWFTLYDGSGKELVKVDLFNKGNPGTKPGGPTPIQSNNPQPTQSSPYPTASPTPSPTTWPSPIPTIGPVNQTPVAGDFNISNLTQTVGSVKPVTITPKIGKSPGTITIRYAAGETVLPALPTTAGTYIVWFDVAEAPGWNAVTWLNAGTLKIEGYSLPTMPGGGMPTSSGPTSGPTGPTSSYSPTPTSTATSAPSTPQPTQSNNPQPTTGPTPTPTATSTPIPIEMVSVTGGSFQMGKELGTASSYGDNTPVHTVTLSGFKISKHQVTQAQYQSVMGSNPAYSYGVGNNYPVYYVSWYDAIEFCNKLSEQEGYSLYYTIDKVNKDPNNTNSYDSYKWTVTCNSAAEGYRLPTEAQWEYAAKGGATQGAYTYAGSNTIGDVAWYSGNSSSMTHAVGTKTANSLGLYDMSGNVWEWCWDWYGSYTSDNTQVDPAGAAAGVYRVLRGGGCINDASNARLVDRYYYYPNSGFVDIGFRLVRP